MHYHSALDMCSELCREVRAIAGSPSAGGVGLGWEMWCDGPEITKFTYFQQAEGQPLDHPAIEITSCDFGLEHILMTLAGVLMHSAATQVIPHALS